jgi:alpha-galactosidase
MRRSTPFLLATLFFLLSIRIADAASSIVVANGDATISRDLAAGTWTIGSASAALTLGLDTSRDFTIVKFVGPSGKAAASTGLPDTVVRVGTQTLLFGNRAAGFTFAGASVEAYDARIQLNAAYDLRSQNLHLTRHYAVVPGSPSFETWTTFEPTSGAVTLGDLNALQLTVATGTLHYVTGLQGDAAGLPNENAFTLQQQTLTNGQHFAIGAEGRASEQTVPWFAIDSAQGEFYAALMWSGAWALNVTRAGNNLALTLGLAPMTTSITASVDGPHAIFGVADGGASGAAAALRSYVLDGVRSGRPLSALVTYNTWFAYGTEIDEDSMRAEMKRSAALGVELFVIDAGWYEGTGAAGAMDFDAGLGSWTVDAARFPNGLRPLRDYAHELGMQFGIWVEPERVNLSLVGAPGVDESWLATNHGSYGSDHAAQICMATTAGRAWVVGKLTALLDDVQPDYLKWDNNMWVNCDRDGHDHGPTDGNFAHVSALYGMLQTLRDRYPSLQIENVSGGGNRLDVGMLRYSDVAWMDDRTAPSVHVRHNVEGLSAVFPPAYLLSFVTDQGAEPLHDAPDLSLYFRSRMVGALGLCFRTADLTDDDQANIAREIGIYKAMRTTLSVAAGALLSAQAGGDGPAWDVLQETSPDGTQLVVSAFQSDTGTGSVNVKPKALDSATMYQVQSVDTGVLGTATGADLMANGIDVLQSPNSAAHVLIIRARQQ